MDGVPWSGVCNTEDLHLCQRWVTYFHSDCTYLKKTVVFTVPTASCDKKSQCYKPLSTSTSTNIDTRTYTESETGRKREGVRRERERERGRERVRNRERERERGREREREREIVSLFAGCLTSQQHASVSQGRICSNIFTCCHTEIEVADQTFYLTQSQYTDTGPISRSADSISAGAWQGSRSANWPNGMTRPQKNPGAWRIRTRDLPLSRWTSYH